MKNNLLKKYPLFNEKLEENDFGYSIILESRKSNLKINNEYIEQLIKKGEICNILNSNSDPNFYINHDKKNMK